jgi:hypothetical protein
MSDVFDRLNAEPEMVKRVRLIISMIGCANAYCVFNEGQCECGEVAKKVIAAMREPTKAMLHEATMVIPTWTDDISRAKWHAMIDAALNT